MGSPKGGDNEGWDENHDESFDKMLEEIVGDDNTSPTQPNF
jgi:hypothetical protein